MHATRRGASRWQGRNEDVDCLVLHGAIVERGGCHGGSTVAVAIVLEVQENLVADVRAAMEAWRVARSSHGGSDDMRRRQ